MLERQTAQLNHNRLGKPHCPELVLMPDPEETLILQTRAGRYGNNLYLFNKSLIKSL